jgi:hypothetical protein
MKDVTQLDGNPVATVAFTANANTIFTPALMSVPIADANGVEAIAAYVTVEAQSLRYAFGVDPSTTLGHLVASGGSFWVRGPAALKALRLRNAADGSNFKVVVTVFYAG